jgi:hypothetical protein
MRICDATGERMTSGYVVDHGDTLLHFSEKKYLIDHLRTLDWIDADGNEVRLDDDRDLLDYFYAEEYFYYTTFDDEDDYEEI